MAGLPPMLGFIGKEKLYEAALDAPLLAAALAAVFVLANVANVYAALAVGWRPFWAKPAGAPAPHDAPAAMFLGPLVLGSLGLVLGIAPWLAGQWYAQSAAGAILGMPSPMDLKLWHGLNMALLLSGITLAAGLAVYALRQPLRRMQEGIIFLDQVGPAVLYDRLLDGLLKGAAWHTHVVQNGYLRNYVLVILGFLLLVPGSTIALRGGFEVPAFPEDVHLYEALVCLLIAIAAIAMTIVHERLAAVACLAAVGYGVALIFIFFGAPDLAMTQFVVETLGLIIMILILYALPRFSHYTRWPERTRDWIVAAFAGAFMGALVMTASDLDLGTGISSFFVENSVPQGHGRNVVNVILVDFRALDTLGEISVLAIAALGAFGLLRYSRHRRSAE
jgi:multicomponent Na+:H+ antiporter subunit A